MTTSGGGGYLLHAIKMYVVYNKYEYAELDLLMLTHKYFRYDDPSAEPVVAHRRTKATKQSTMSSQEELEASTSQASRIDTDVHYTDVRVDS
jgi:hypothetical protein